MKTIIQGVGGLFGKLPIKERAYGLKNNLKKKISRINAVLTIAAMVLTLVQPALVSARENPPVYNLDILTINGQQPPFSFSCPANPLFSPVSITGGGSVSGNYPGLMGQYHIQVSWGDGTTDNDVTSSSIVQLTKTGPGEHDPFDFTFTAGPHPYGIQTSPLRVTLYHQAPPGNDGTGGDKKGEVKRQLCLRQKF